MPRLPKTQRVSLHQIRKYLGNSSLEKLQDEALIDAFLPAWSDDAFKKGIDSNVRSRNIKSFCGGNRKGGARLDNKDELDAICYNLLNEKQYLDDALRLSRSWVEDLPKVRADNFVFTGLELCSKECPTEYERKQFACIRETLDKLLSIDTVESLTYALFLLVVVGVLQEKVVEVQCLYMADGVGNNNPHLRRVLYGDKMEIEEAMSPTDPSKSSYCINTDTFLYNLIGQVSPRDIQCIDMAFHGGDQWLTDDRKAYLLTQILAKGIRVRVLVNTEAAVSLICEHMRQEFKVYMGFDKALTWWKEREKKYSGVLEVRVSNIPMLHRTYLIRRSSGNSTAKVDFYAYGEYSPDHAFGLLLDEKDRGYSVLESEFDYLWQLAGGEIVSAD